VNALQLKLLPARLAGKSVMHNTDAYSLYLKGQYFARRASAADVDQGISYLQQAIAMEPDFAPAHAELASAYFFMGTFGSGPADAMIERCRAEVDRAQRLDPSLPVLHILRANLASVSYDWPTAEAEAEQALKLDPRNSDALYRRGVIERALGRPNEALELYRRALILDPLRVIDHIQLAMLLHSLGRLDETRAAAEAALAINPTAVKAHFLLGLVELSRSHLDAASAQMAQESGEWYRLEGQAMVAFAAKRWRDSDAALKRLIDVHQQIAAVQIAQLYAYRGERDKAFEWLDRAAQQRDPGLVFFQTDVLFASLRGDARFEALRRRLHVAT
jgi:tetratricopeptide (TPR) repeat protein